MRASFLFAIALVAQGASATIAHADAPTVSNVTMIQQRAAGGGTELLVQYDLASPNGPATVELLASADGGTSFSLSVASISGDVGVGVAPGASRTIHWAIGTDHPEQTFPNLVVRVRAEDGVAIPLQISSTVPQDATVESAAQTLTFTFGEAVSGFDASDVVVAGAAKGAFTPVSATSYTLELTGTGGTVSVQVAPNSATAASGTGNGSAAASFSNYYRDTVTVYLVTTPAPAVPMHLIRIPSGTFEMGSPVGELSRFADETPFTATISGDYYMGTTEVTQAQWIAISGAWPSTAPLEATSGGAGVGDDLPAYGVSYGDALSFLALLNLHIASTGQGTMTVRLPTEAEWEFAARGGTTTRFGFGDGFADDESCADSVSLERSANMWYCGNNGSFMTSTYGAKSVGQKTANILGLCDMHGNVWEWCRDWYGTYPTGTQIDPAGPGVGSHRVIRGGGWGNPAQLCRSAQRNYTFASDRSYNIGFRVAATP